MLKGLLIGLTLFIAGDLVLNRGAMTSHAAFKIHHWATASSNSVNNSVFNR